MRRRSDRYIIPAGLALITLWLAAVFNGAHMIFHAMFRGCQ